MTNLEFIVQNLSPIPQYLIADSLGINRGRFSLIKRALVQPTEEEARKLSNLGHHPSFLMEQHNENYE